MMRATLEEAENEARKLGRLIKSNMPQGFGFTLVLYSYGADGVMTYLSSGVREDCIKMLRECADAIETNKPQI